MAKNKRQNRSDIRRGPLSKIFKSSKKKLRAPNLSAVELNSSTIKQLQARPVIPFGPSDKVLLVGEGDFSYARSLLQHHEEHLANLTATTFESRETLLKKHPQAEQYIETLTSSSRQGLQNLDSSSQEDSGGEELEENAPLNRDAVSARKCEVLYSIDATRLGRYKSISKHKWDRIVFNFPHVGGKSTDVNRQVRFNQGLLSGFLHSAIHLLSTPNSTSPSGGTVLITIFEGEPYTLWNIRDLARNAGFAVLRSFKFDAGAYPGYHHARTFGNLISKNGTKIEPTSTSGEGQVRVGRWRGEERLSRTYEFGVKDAVIPSHRDGIDNRNPSSQAMKKRKRNARSTSSEDED